MKKIIYGLLSLIVISAIILTVSLDSFGKKYAQEFAQKLLKTPVKISQFNTHILDKSLDGHQIFYSFSPLFFI
ncbi:MAG: hypothetical protein HAW58_05860, partial [Candidatus Thioglobus sp.]|nr:hypothetical protein [Candidatus Thioglobus sp.]